MGGGGGGPKLSRGVQWGAHGIGDAQQDPPPASAWGKAGSLAGLWGAPPIPGGGGRQPPLGGAGQGCRWSCLWGVITRGPTRGRAPPYTHTPPPRRDEGDAAPLSSPPRGGAGRHRGPFKAPPRARCHGDGRRPVNPRRPAPPRPFVPPPVTPPPAGLCLGGGGGAPTPGGGISTWGASSPWGSINLRGVPGGGYSPLWGVLTPGAGH